MTERDVMLEYETRGMRVSLAAVVVFWLAIVSAVGFFLVIPAAVVWVAALVVRGMISRRPEVGGYGYATAAVMVSGSAALLGMVVLVLLPSLGRPHEISEGSRCAANLRGLAQSMHVYGADNNDSYPLVNFATYSAKMNDARPSTGGTTTEDTYKEIYEGNLNAGSVQASLWILCLRGDVAPKQFMCWADPWLSKAGGAMTSSPLLDPTNRYFTNFQSGKQLSYSITYPWAADGKPGNWWKATSDASMPLLADMAPKQGTGTPKRDLVPKAAPVDNKTWNSANHQGDGQNVSFGDAHAEFVRSPDVGQDHDNIYSMAGSPSKGPAQFGGIPAGRGAPMLMAEKAPFDVVMLPVRDETTGGM